MRIGIAGITTSGKSTLADALVKEFNGVRCCVDDFYFTQNFPMMKFLGKEIIDWETPKCIHWDAFEEYCETTKGDMIFIDSYLLFYSKKVAESIDALIVLEYLPEDFEVALARRIKRFSNEEVPSDYNENPFASDTNFEAKYFADVAWKFAMDYPEYREPKDFNKPMCRLRAINPVEENIASATEFIRSVIDQI